ncbi:unnamed protein product [Psylliodes chrysocephalus]|uniref:Lysosomal Pro-X carboxypeptidase n=1 Tax=Psylliodes chrysocephalus TaxID=3402493 RepID=A0A9P0D2P5_9CUCU|nr:unnamed protein product [Psylliodes chrysocephala]
MPSYGTANKPSSSATFRADRGIVQMMKVDKDKSEKKIKDAIELLKATEEGRARAKAEKLRAEINRLKHTIEQMNHMLKKMNEQSERQELKHDALIKQLINDNNQQINDNNKKLINDTHKQINNNKSNDTDKQNKDPESIVALADFALLIQEMKKILFKNFNHNSSNTEPIIAFGGYYAGMLSALLRMKYPFLVRAALTSSAPLFYLPGLTSCEGYYQKATQVFERHGHEKCVKTIQLGWNIIETLTKSKIGMNYISSTWKLCTKLQTAEDVKMLVDWLSKIFIELSMANYPYPSNYYNPVPAFPVMVFCDKLNTGYYNDTKAFIQIFANALQMYTNYTGKTYCNNIYSKEEDLNDVAWKYQTCTELIMPKCSTEQDMFITKKWVYEKFASDCYKKFEVRPKPNFMFLAYGINKLKHYTNILFSSSTTDPASWGVVDFNKSDEVDKSLETYQIMDAPYLMEFRGANPSDNNYILEARKFYISVLKKWLKLN